MGLTGSSALVKYLIFAFSLLSVILGIVLISVGAVVRGVYSSNFFLDERFLIVRALLIATGVSIFVVAFFGCYGSIKENYCMVLMFALLLVFIFILEFSAGIAGYVLRDNTVGFLENKLNESMYHYNDSDKISSEDWDTLQSTFSCCGMESPGDWGKVFMNMNGTLPATCCFVPHQTWSSEICAVYSKNLYKEGCLTKLGTYVAAHAALLGGVGIGIAVIQFLGVVLACNLARTIKKSYESI